MNEDDLRREKEQGFSAKRILEDEVFQSAIDSLKAQTLQAWKSSGYTQDREREILWMRMRVLEDVVSALESYVETGKLAEIQIRELLEQNSNKV